MRFSRTAVGVIAFCVVTALGGCGGGGGGGPRSCDEDAECGGTSRCLAHACVADLGPIAVLRVPESPRAFDLVELDASESTDADAPLGDHIAEYRWSVESLDHACEPPVIAGTGSLARVRFPCAGAFRVQLVVVDERGAESAPASAELSVAAHEGTLSVSADQSVGHKCSGKPPTCTLDGTPPLTAGVAAGVQTFGTVAYHWVAEGQGPHKTVTFTPSADVANPTVQIAVDVDSLDAIVDDWVLRVTATDEVGKVGEAVTRISVTNRPPVLLTTPMVVSVDHTFSDGYYRAVTALGFWQDPDGDPMELAADSVGTTACPTLSVRPSGSVRVDCLKKYTGTPDQSGFSGDQVVKIRPRDHWSQAKDLTSVTIHVANRPVVAANTSISLGASRCPPTGACCEYEAGDCVGHKLQCQAASGTLNLAVSDEDGDPVRVNMSGMTPADFICGAGTTCAVQYSIAANQYCPTSGSRGSASGSFTVTDGKATVGPYTATAQ